MNFNDLKINDDIKSAVSKMGFEKLTPIQTKAIPDALRGKDIIGQAQTGSGKTLAFGIPVLNKLFTPDKSPQAIILCPTRELCVQVADEMVNLIVAQRAYELNSKAIQTADTMMQEADITTSAGTRRVTLDRYPSQEKRRFSRVAASFSGLKTTGCTLPSTKNTTATTSTTTAANAASS